MWLHTCFNYLVSMVIFMNIMLILMTSPTTNPNSDTFKLAKHLDLACTIFFIFEAFLKIVALGFIHSSIPN
jgi:Ion transport protein